MNAKLQKIFGQLGFVEQTGHGVPLIIEHYGRQAFEVTDHFINVVIPFHFAVQTQQNVLSVPHSSAMSDVQKKVYDYIIANPSASVKDMTEALGFSNSYIRKIIAWLKANNLITRVGSNKTGYWSVT